MNEEAQASLWVTDFKSAHSFHLFGLTWPGVILVWGSKGSRRGEAWVSRAVVGTGLPSPRARPCAAGCLEAWCQDPRQHRPLGVLQIFLEKAASPQLLKKRASTDVGGCGGVASVIISHRLGKEVHFVQ